MLKLAVGVATVSVTEFDWTTGEPGLLTTIWIEPADVKKLDGMETIISVAFWVDTGTNWPFAWTVAFAAKPLPMMPTDVGTFEEVLTVTLEGVMEEIVGTVAATTNSVGVVVLPPVRDYW
jgi:hypothetical protein